MRGFDSKVMETPVWPLVVEPAEDLVVHLFEMIHPSLKFQPMNVDDITSRLAKARGR